MIKKLLIPLFLLFSIISFAQQGTASPYSYYGIGDVRFKGTNENRSMGGVSIFSDSIHMNLQNPASYSNLKLTSFSVGGTFSSGNLKSDEGTNKTQRTTLDYFAVGLPLGKFGASFGLIPYSSVGYKIKTTDLVNQSINRFNGDGGVNKAFLGFGYEISKGLSIGLDASYNFGKISTSSINYIAAAEYGTQEMNVSDLSGFNVKIGAMFNRKITKKLDIFSGITYVPESKLNSNTVRNTHTIVYNGDLAPTTVDSYDAQNSSTSIVMPSHFTFGVGIGQIRKWVVGTEITVQKPSDFGSRYSSMSNVSFERATKYSVGGYYIPNFTSFSSYFQKVTYRAGFRYENTGLVLSDQSIKDYALTGGFGLPLGGTFSNINLGFELGQRGTLRANLVQEKYVNVILSLSLNDRWFVKSKYN